MRQRQQIDAPRGPGGSPCPCASKGTNGRAWGGRSSDVDRSDVAGHERSDGWLIRSRGDALSAVTRSVSSSSGRGHGGEELRRWRDLVGKGATATGRNELGGEGVSMRKLTVVGKGDDAGSEKARR